MQNYLRTGDGNAQYVLTLLNQITQAQVLTDEELF